jgi:hypothetical protein
MILFAQQLPSLGPTNFNPVPSLIMLAVLWLAGELFFWYIEPRNKESFTVALGRNLMRFVLAVFFLGILVCAMGS